MGRASPNMVYGYDRTALRSQIHVLTRGQRTSPSSNISQPLKTSLRSSPRQVMVKSRLCRRRILQEWQPSRWHPQSHGTATTTYSDRKFCRTTTLPPFSQRFWVGQSGTSGSPGRRWYRTLWSSGTQSSTRAGWVMANTELLSVNSLSSITTWTKPQAKTLWQFVSILKSINRCGRTPRCRSWEWTMRLSRARWWIDH